MKKMKQCSVKPCITLAIRYRQLLLCYNDGLHESDSSFVNQYSTNLRKGNLLTQVMVIKMNQIAEFVKKKRREAGLSQEEFAIRSGLGLRFVRELEQGKETVRMDKVNVALAMFGSQVVPGKISEN